MYKVLILTDHRHHSVENSLYELMGSMKRHPLTASLDIATRFLDGNKDFFACSSHADLWVSSVEDDFQYTVSGKYFTEHIRKADISSYDWVWLRMPPPLSVDFLNFISDTFQKQVIINDPKGIFETGSKKFLLNVPELCPHLKLCTTKQDIIQFKEQFPIVLKPLRQYGGKGIVKIQGNEVDTNGDTMSLETFLEQLPHDFEYLAVRFLKNVGQGDKRIVVVNGEIIGASLRIPPKDSWICNAAMGGTSHITAVTTEEEHIVRVINPHLAQRGIVMYGVDTLVDDNGKRVLSEINTTSIGGVKQMAAQQNLPLADKVVELIWAYFLTQKN